MKSYRKDLLQWARHHGWKVSQTRGGHYCLVHQDGTSGPVYAPASASDWRSLRNTIAMLRRAEANDLRGKPCQP